MNYRNFFFVIIGVIMMASLIKAEFGNVEIYKNNTLINFAKYLTNATSGQAVTGATCNIKFIHWNMTNVPGALFDLTDNSNGWYNYTLAQNNVLNMTGRFFYTINCTKSGVGASTFGEFILNATFTPDELIINSTNNIGIILNSTLTNKNKLIGIETNITQILTNLSDLNITVSAINRNVSNITFTQQFIKTDVWNYPTRTLTSFGTLITDIWASASRTLTSFFFSVGLNEGNITNLTQTFNNDINQSHGEGNYSNTLPSSTLTTTTIQNLTNTINWELNKTHSDGNWSNSVVSSSLNDADKLNITNTINSQLNQTHGISWWNGTANASLTDASTINLTNTINSDINNSHSQGNYSNSQVVVTGDWETETSASSRFNALNSTIDNINRTTYDFNKTYPFKSFGINEGNLTEIDRRINNSHGTGVYNASASLTVDAIDERINQSHGWGLYNLSKNETSTTTNINTISQAGNQSWQIAFILPFIFAIIIFIAILLSLRSKNG